ncbi:MAG: nitroreductase family protein [Chloroflexota bacterium]
MNLNTPEHLAIIDHALNTTRSVRKRLDLTRPVEPEILEECLEIALQAPTGSNQQKWHFMVITDEEKRTEIANYYRRAFEGYRNARAEAQPTAEPAHVDESQMERVVSSAQYLSDNMHKVPVLIIACYEGRVENSSVSNQAGFYGSILPAVWSLMIALRARGLGSAWTTLHLPAEKEVAQLLGIPDTVTQTAMLPVAYFTGDDFKPAKRIPAKELTYWDSWGETRS